MGKTRVLMVAEDVTLAHVGRMVSLAQRLDVARYDLTLACGRRFMGFVHEAGLSHVHLDTMDPELFQRRLDNATPIHTLDVIEKSVQDDLALIAESRPDVVVGDFRVSLGISAELAKVPYIAVVNAYWSPGCRLPLPTPEHPIVRLFGLAIAQAIAPLVLPLNFRFYLRPFNKVRRHLGLAPLPSLQAMYTHGNQTLYLDLPELVPVSPLPASHAYAGPVLWEPSGALPPWWQEVPSDRPAIYLNVGSSGAGSRLFEAAVEALGGLGLSVLVASAGGQVGQALPDNFFVAEFIPGLAACARADAVICNGGSGTIYQALAAGTPLLCVPTNLDQYLATRAALDAGVARSIRAGCLDARGLAAELTALLETPAYRREASALTATMARYDAAATLDQHLRRLGKAGGTDQAA